jgi:hypothetical protein
MFVFHIVAQNIGEALAVGRGGKSSLYCCWSFVMLYNISAA